MKKPTVAVVFGSRSTEHDVSIITAISSIIKPLELSQKYHVVPVYIAKDGRWFSDAKLSDIKLYQSGKLDEFLAKQRPVAVLFDHGLKLVQAKGFKVHTTPIDVVFPALHGTHGEDGELMGVCDMADVPYVGCDVTASALAMDKVLAKQVVLASGLDTAKFFAFSKTEYETDSAEWTKRINTLKYPVFVKPAHLGSSIGISRVAKKQDLANAIEVALHYDNKALVEEAVPNLIEVTLPIIGNEELTPALLEEPLLSTEDFFDFETKYMHGGKKGKDGKKGGQTAGAQGYSNLPADLPQALYDQAEAVGMAVYRALGCRGIARIDMLIDSKAKKVYFNEVNPLPGSLYAHNWRHKGVSNVDLVCRLIELAQERFAAKKQLETTFSTSFLQQF